VTKLNKNNKAQNTTPNPSNEGLGDFGVFEKILISILALSIGLFILLPVIRLVMASFISNNGLSLSNYENIFSKNIGLLKNSVFSSALSAAFSTVLATAVALHTVSVSRRSRKLLMSILLLTMVSPPFVNSLAYIMLYGRRGWITYSLLGLSINPYNWTGVVLMQTLSFSSLNAIFLIGMMDKVNKGLAHAARDLGATTGKAFMDVILPLLTPGILACLLLNFIRGLADFGTPIVIGGRFNTVAAEIYMQITAYADLSKAATLNTLIFLPSIILFFIYRRLLGRSDILSSWSNNRASASDTLELSGLPRIIATSLSCFFFIVMLLQYICIFAGGFVKAVKGVYHFSLEHFDKVILYETSSLKRSIIYALIVGVGGALFSIVFSYYIERRKIIGRHVLDFLSTMPVMIPGTCFGIGYILAFHKPPFKLTGTALIVILNMLFRQLPNSTKICSAAISQIPHSFEDAARDIGAGRLQILLHIILPNLKHAFFTCFVYNFTSAMTTAGAILFLIQPSQKIAVFRLFDAVNTGNYGVACLISTIIILVSLLVNIIVMGLTNDRRKGGRRNVFTAFKSS